jgi:hypothetical protein
MTAKLLLLSVVVMMMAIPVLTARHQNAQRGLTRALFLFLAFNVLYLLAVRFVYPRLN